VTEALIALARQLHAEARLWTGARRDVLLQTALAVAIAASDADDHLRRIYLDEGQGVLARHMTRRALEDDPAVRA
jgi:hypothetical protein